MNWHAAIGILSSIALFAPVVLILAFGLLRRKSYLALFIYCLLAFTYNLMTENIIIVPRSFERTWGIINNLLDFPLMITFLMMFSTSVAQKSRMKLYLVVYLCFELVVMIFFGLSIKTITIVMGPGLVLILIISSYFFFEKVQQSIIHIKALGKAFLTAAIVFAYGCFSFIYVMHYVIEMPDVPNIFLIYFLVTIVYCSLLATGLFIENKRIRKLEELLVTRKELHRFFNDEKSPATSGKTPDREWKWN
ncbi:MAG: hypothetical protein EPN92_11440 [Chitinophagaceae bacterium]|nr:MAG: hypothetical protein EPN92_11440 [Chitinophagaceae bacterium]